MRDDTLKKQIELLTAQTRALQCIYKRLITLLKDFALYAIVFFIINIVIYFLATDKLHIIYIILNFLLNLILIVYAILIFSCRNQYKRVFYDGFNVWCLLSDKLDWSSIRRKSLYKSNFKSTEEVLFIMNSFYNEFQKKYSPVATRMNYFKIIVWGYFLIWTYSLLLFFINIDLI